MLAQGTVAKDHTAVIAHERPKGNWATTALYTFMIVGTAVIVRDAASAEQFVCFVCLVPPRHAPRQDRTVSCTAQVAVNVATQRVVTITLTNPTLAEYMDAVVADTKTQPPVCQCSVTSARFGDTAALAVTRHPICDAVRGYIAACEAVMSAAKPLWRLTPGPTPGAACRTSFCAHRLRCASGVAGTS